MATKKKWSAGVTATSDAMDVDAGTFKQRSAKKIAHDVEHDAERSTRKKTSSFQAAMSMLTFYINRAGSNLSAPQRKILERAKDVLRAEYGRDSEKPAKKTAVKKPAAKKSGAKKSLVKKSARKKTAAKKKTASHARR